ncbi:Retrovirus-related Pol polyprotein from transposon RE2 [Bienertia sinuspersici]
MCHNLNFFLDFHNIEAQNGYITLPDGSKSLVKHKGTVKLGSGLILQGVLHTLAFEFNLISVPKLCKDMKVLTYFDGDICYLQDHSQTRHLQLGKLQNGLYYLDSSLIPTYSGTIQVFAGSSNSSAIDKAKLWHLRMGHMPFNHLNKVHSDIDVQGCIDIFFLSDLSKSKTDQE